jgi:malate dehydrogenase
MTTSHPKVTIVGAGGGVGSALTYTLATSRLPYDIVLIGRRPQAITCQLMDLDALAGRPDVGTIRAGNRADFADSDIIVLAAAVPFDPGKKRADFLPANAAVLRPYVQAIADLPADWPGHVIVVSNPVDPLVTWLARRARIDRHRILGYTWNDSLRLRAAIAQAVGVPAAQVEAWILGEHGPHFTPLFDRVRVGGNKLELPPARQAEVLAAISEWYARWTSLGLIRTTMWSTSNGVAQFVEAVTQRRPGVWAASLFLDGEYDLSDVSLGVPVFLHDGGITEILQWEIPDAAAGTLRTAAEVIRGQAATLDELRRPAPAPAYPAGLAPAARQAVFRRRLRRTARSLGLSPA